MINVVYHKTTTNVFLQVFSVGLVKCNISALPQKLIFNYYNVNYIFEMRDARIHFPEPQILDVLCSVEERAWTSCTREGKFASLPMSR